MLQTAPKHSGLAVHVYDCSVSVGLAHLTWVLCYTLSLQRGSQYQHLSPEGLAEEGSTWKFGLSASVLTDGWPP
jgi:hypothetical protein